MTHSPLSGEAELSDTISGYLETITFRNEENGYTIARLHSEADSAPVTIVGHLSGVNEGETLRLCGEWKQHPRFGRQFQVDSFEFVNPDTEQGIERYLGSGLIKGIGPVIAERIVAAFGRETLEVIENRTELLKTVPGLGKKKVARIKEAWGEQREIRRLMIFLQGHGIGGALAARIFRRYRDRGVEAVSRDPYALAREVRGIGFATADRIARSLGFAPDNPARLESGLVYTGELAADRGHTSLPLKLFLRRASELLEVDAGMLEEVLNRLADLGRLELENGDDGTHVYTSECHWAEITVADNLKRLMEQTGLDLDNSHPSGCSGLDTIAKFERSRRLKLSANQRRAIDGAFGERVCIITGGPGTGKTTLVAALVALADQLGITAVLAAPTGRAAKRMSEATGSAASTIHRMLGWSFSEGSFLHNQQRRLKGDLFVIDEVSMVDIKLMASLLEALPDGAVLVLMGDSDQLPSIGPGRVLADLIGSGKIPTFRLEEIFRQAGRSRIVQNAHRVRQGQMPEGAPPLEDQESDSGLSPGENDFFIVNQRDPLKAREMLVKLAGERLAARFGIDPASQLQVITPMNRGECGTRELNRALQAELNPAGAKITFTGGGFRVGDRVMQVRNDYEKDVFNGDVGRIVSAESESQTVLVDYDGRLVAYEGMELDDLNMEYAVTVHKSQGSEYPAVLIILLPEHRVMLQRNLLYTAISRGKNLVVLIGDPSAVKRAVSNTRVQLRHTRLAARLKKM
ncbi:MAG: ATP-dependent RecD-like DNA helicase [Candidatus Glassbacteria bacterium]|nr:ATP-dependent RecD-like DNA helicase [Candidatus Glassbacteria bacterium]